MRQFWCGLPRDSICFLCQHLRRHVLGVPIRFLGRHLCWHVEVVMGVVIGRFGLVGIHCVMMMIVAAMSGMVGGGVWVERLGCIFGL